MIPRIDDFECCELAAGLLNMRDDDWEEEDVWDKLWDEHNIDSDGFCWMINQLVPIIDIGKSPLTGTVFKGFSRELKPGLKEWLVKVEVEGVQA